MNPITLLIFLLIGALAGLIGALCGVGGGVIMVPAFTLALGLDHKVAVATSMAVIVPIALSASTRNALNGYIHWPTVLATAIGAALVAWFAADWLQTLSNATLKRIFAVVMIGVGIHLLLSSRGT